MNCWKNIKTDNIWIPILRTENRSFIYRRSIDMFRMIDTDRIRDVLKELSRNFLFLIIIYVIISLFIVIIAFGFYLYEDVNDSEKTEIEITENTSDDKTLTIGWISNESLTENEISCVRDKGKNIISNQTEGETIRNILSITRSINEACSQNLNFNSLDKRIN